MTPTEIGRHRTSGSDVADKWLGKLDRTTLRVSGRRGRRPAWALEVDDKAEPFERCNISSWRHLCVELTLRSVVGCDRGNVGRVGKPSCRASCTRSDGPVACAASGKR